LPKIEFKNSKVKERKKRESESKAAGAFQIIFLKKKDIT